jgi:hypothetical protein
MFRFIFNVRDNADYSFPFTWVDGSGDPVDLTGSEMLMQGKRSAKDIEPVFELSTADDTIVLDGTTTNLFTLVFAKGLIPLDEGLDQSTYVADLLRKVGASITPVGYGLVVVVKGPTVWT